MENKKLKIITGIISIIFNILIFLSVIVGVKYLDIYPILKGIATINSGNSIDNFLNLGFVFLNLAIILYAFIFTINRVVKIIKKLQNIELQNTWDIWE